MLRSILSVIAGSALWALANEAAAKGAAAVAAAPQSPEDIELAALEAVPCKPLETCAGGDDLGTFWMPKSASVTADATDWLYYGLIGLCTFFFVAIAVYGSLVPLTAWLVLRNA